MVAVPARPDLPAPAALRLSRWLATPLLAAPYAAGWLVGALVAACLWCAASVRLGWRDGLRR